MNIYDYKLENILFLDIETVPQFEDFHDMPEGFQELWKKKAGFLLKPDEDQTPSDIYQKAGIYAEFGKIVCISVGNIHQTGNENAFRLKSFYGNDEKKLLIEFSEMVSSFSKNKEVFLAAHNGKEFDFPYIARRMIINGLRLPYVLQVAGKKPWEVTFIDTLELWKFGDYKNYTSLDLLTYIMGIPSPKDDIDGSMVADIFYKENNLERIVKYCEKDVLAIAQLFLKFRNENILKEENITSVTDFTPKD